MRLKNVVEELHPAPGSKLKARVGASRDGLGLQELQVRRGREKRRDQ